MINEKLQIILITYNRAARVENTLKQFFSEESPVKNCEFIVLDNNSTDTTREVVESWTEKFSNIKYLKNRYNVGLAGNITKAMELADKDYVWIIGDDDKYDFSNWQEVENAIINDEKLICLARYALPDEVKDDVAAQLLQVTFITGAIYSTSLFSDTVIKNAYDNIYTLFPHMAVVVNFLNKGGRIYVVNKPVCDNGLDYETNDYSYIRGANAADVYPRTASMCWISGYCNILSKLEDFKLRERAIDAAILFKDIFGDFENFYNFLMSYYHCKETFMHFIDIYTNISEIHKDRLKKDYIRHYRNKRESENICDLAIKKEHKVYNILGIKIKIKQNS